jgi:hypothetical protein
VLDVESHTVADADAQAESVEVREEDTQRVGVGEREGVMLKVRVGEPVLQALPERDTVPVVLGHMLTVLDRLCVKDAELHCEAEALRHRLGLVENVGAAEADTEGHADGVEDRD